MVQALQIYAPEVFQTLAHNSLVRSRGGRDGHTRLRRSVQVTKERETLLILWCSVIKLCQYCYFVAIFQALEPETTIQLHLNAKVLVMCSRVYLWQREGSAHIPTGQSSSICFRKERIAGLNMPCKHVPECGIDAEHKGFDTRADVSDMLNIF